LVFTQLFMEQYRPMRMAVKYHESNSIAWRLTY